MPARSAIDIELRQLGLEAIDTWAIPVAICTAHTVLGLLQNVRRSLYAWPSLIRAAFIFDEIHAFPDKLFRHLLRFLEIFRSQPVLLMTATLPLYKKEALIKACEKRGGLLHLPGPKERENAKRYTLRRTSEDHAWAEADHVIKSGGKVLWICNTVDRAIATARKAMEHNIPTELFHSRYRYRDRLLRQRKVIDGFFPAVHQCLQ